MGKASQESIDTHEETVKYLTKDAQHPLKAGGSVSVRLVEVQLNT